MRYFNVYGPNENHKGKMASTIFHFNQQIRESSEAKLFFFFLTYEDGEQKRDFVYVKDCADLNLWFFQNPQFSGIFNVGTGKAETFNTVANSIIEWHSKGIISYIKIPENLINSYQSFTQADISSLKSINCPIKFTNVQEGIKKYLSILNN